MNQLDQDRKNAKLFAVISIAAFVVLHILAFTLSSAPLANMGIYPALWALPVLAVIALVITIKEVSAGASVTEEQKWPYILLLILSFASAIAIGYTPAGLSL